jgi:hypothetical protein
MAKAAKKTNRPLVKTKAPNKKEIATVKTTVPKDSETLKIKTISAQAPYLLPKGRLITAEGWKRQMIRAAKK